MFKIAVTFVVLLQATVYSETATLEDLQQMALSENPRIKAMEAEARMMKDRIPRSTALEDPRLKLGLNNMPADSFSFTREDMTSKEIGVSQMIPLGKLPYRKKIAVLEYEKALVRLRAEKVEILHMLRMNYYELMYARSSIAVLEEIKKQIRLVIDGEAAAAMAGTGSLANVIKARIEYNMVDEEIINLKQRLRETEQNMHYLAGTTADIPAGAIPVPEFREIPVETVRREMLASNPELKLFSLEVEISRHEISLKKAESASDMEIGMSYMQRDDAGGMKRTDMVNVMASFTVPFWFWKKNIPMVDEMKNRSEAMKSFYQDALNRMNARAETLVSRMAGQRDLYRLYSDKLIPQTELALEANLSRYRTNSAEFMPVVDTVRMLLRYRKEISMAVKEYYVSYSELNALMGVEVLQ